MNREKHKKCKENKCYNGNQNCHLNILLDNLNEQHQCPCYTCIVSIVCKELCYKYTSYVDGILIKLSPSLYDIEEKKKFNDDGAVTTDFLRIITRRSESYRPYTKASIVMCAVTTNKNLQTLHENMGMKLPIIKGKKHLLGTVETEGRDRVRIGPMLSDIFVDYQYLVFYLMKKEESPNLSDKIRCYYTSGNNMCANVS